MLASTIIDGVAEILQDTAGVTWTPAQLLAWLNDAQRAVVSVRPGAGATTGNVDLVAGTKQSLPADGLRLLAVVRNMGVSGTTPGRAVRLVERASLDEHTPYWHSATPSSVVKEYAIDDRDAKVFWVNPPADGTTKVEATYSATPADIASAATAIGLDDMYAPALTEWMLYRAFARDSEHTPNYVRASGHFNNFFQILGVKIQADMSVSPKQRAHLK